MVSTGNDGLPSVALAEWCTETGGELPGLQLPIIKPQREPSERKIPDVSSQ